ncbi:MAG: ribosome biogenesis GTPase Der [Geminicoccus sp.]|nr:ribosome biogenesis GTPase Der [Geminicoccus sp.]
MFTVALIGRPNVGKSTLFNKLIGRKRAIVHDEPGVTRDWREGEAKIGGTTFRVLDTAGLEEAFDDSLAARMRQQTEQALGQADLALFMIDARVGITPTDEHFSKWLRTAGIETWVIANKCEGRAGNAGVLDAYSLGHGDVHPLSAEHGDGLGSLYTDLVQRVAEAPVVEEADEGLNLNAAQEAEENEDGRSYEIKPNRPLHLVVAGRPNVGKSTLINRLLGQDRLLTGPEAGITRDAIVVDLTWKDRGIRLWDTAGLRRKAHVKDKLETMSNQDTLRAIRFAEVVLLLLDSDGVLDRQDLTIARQVLEEGRGLIIGVNKFDKVGDPKAVMGRLSDRLQTSLAQAKGVITMPLSGLEGYNLDRVLDTAFDARKTWSTRLSTALLNKWLSYHTERHPPPLVAGRRIKLRYATQVKSRPPTFAVFGSRVSELPGSYQSYLINALREDFDLWGTPIRLLLRAGQNPYSGKK